MESAKMLAELTAFFLQAVARIIDAIGKFGTEHDARSLELLVEAQMKALGALVLEVAWLQRLKSLTPPKRLPCVCGHYKRSRGKRARLLRLVLGTMENEERRYYRCDRCKKCEYWGDELRGMTDFSQLAEDRIAVTGKEAAFQPSSDLLRRMGVLKIAASTVRKVCVRLGKKLCAQTDREAAEQHCQKVNPEEKVKRLVISMDGTMVGRVDPQHRRRRSQKTKRKVRGKGPLKNFFHEVKTLVIYEINKSGEALRKTYRATQERVDDFREKVRLEASLRGADTAEVLVFLGDGAAWLWKTAEDLFPKAIQILDWYHAMEHVWAVARAKFPSNELELQKWVQKRESELWSGKVEAVIQAIRETSKQLGTPNPDLSEKARALDARWIAHQNIGYFTNNASRMNYPLYRKQGLSIGSGVVESSCKHLVGKRLKGSGMRWDEPGAEAILALRCHDLNGRWDSLWQVNSVA